MIGTKCYLLVKDLPLIEDADLRNAEALGLLIGSGECNCYAKKTAMSKSQKSRWKADWKSPNIKPSGRMFIIALFITEK